MSFWHRKRGAAMKWVFAGSCGLLFGFLAVAAAGDDAPAGSASGTSLAKPTQGKSASGVTLGRPIAGRANLVEEPPPPTPAPAPRPPPAPVPVAAPEPVRQVSPEPVKQVAYDNPPKVIPPALEEAPAADPEPEPIKKAPAPEPVKKTAQPELIKKAPQRVNPTRSVSVAAKSSVRQRPQELQLVAPDGPERLPAPPAVDGGAVVDPDMASSGVPVEGAEQPGTGVDCN